MSTDAARRVAELTTRLRAADHAYYVLDNPILSDAEYDRLMRELAATHELIVTVEDHSVRGGFGSAVMEAVAAAPVPVLALGVPDRFVQHGRRDLLLGEVGLTPEAVAARTVRALASGTLAGVPQA